MRATNRRSLAGGRRSIAGASKSCQCGRQIVCPLRAHGNPIPVSPPSAADLEAERLAHLKRADAIKKEDERKAADILTRSDEQRETERRFEESQA